MARFCCWHARVNSLWQWSYCFLVLAAEAFLMYRAVLRCQQYNEFPWSSEHKPVTELYVYITLIVVSIMCMPFFLICCIFQVGNYSNDGVRLGRDVLKHHCDVIVDGQTLDQLEAPPGNLHILWRHSGPLAVGLHIAAAFSLLLPMVLLDAQKIRHGFLQPNAIWRSELGVLTTSDTATTLFLQDDGTPYNDSPLFVVSPPTGTLVIESETLSPEFINYMVALVVFSVRYPSVFWHTKLIYSLYFSGQLTIATIFYALAYCNMAMLYKFQTNKEWRPDIQLLLPAEAVLPLYLLSIIFVYFSSIAIFNYGYYHYDESYKQFMRIHRKAHIKPSPPPTGCDGYVPHTVATVALVLFVSSRAPLVYDGVTVYRKTGNTIILASIICDVAYMFVWITMWFCFTIKQMWQFKILPCAAPVPPRTGMNMIRNNLNNEPVLTLNGAMQMGSSIEMDTVDHALSNPLPEGTNELMSSTQQLNTSLSLHEVPDRKPNDASRVTFNASSDDIHLEVRNNARRRSRDRSPNRKRKRKANNEERSETGNGAIPRRVKSDRIRSGSNENLGFDHTPENTITRNYRYSIRDKCGQYYRHSREFTSPPAAQSSPVLDRKDQSDDRDVQVAPDVTLTPELPPKTFGKHQNNNNRPERETAPYRDASPLGRTSADGGYGSHSQSLDNVPYHFLPPSKQSSISRPEGSTPPPPPPPVPPHQKLYPRKKQENNSRSNPSLASRPVPREPNRELRILTKPDMGRRDSALPSSNETSSNDSADNVLCSQV